jgi:mannose-6-phosphate isomerase-like protein (cupin superfamily)
MVLYKCLINKYSANKIPKRLVHFEQGVLINNKMSQKINTENAEHYFWGNKCEGWHLLKTDSLNVIRERMPPGTAEQKHYHRHAQQLFYILSGAADFMLDDKIVKLKPHESIHVQKGIPHCIMNKGEEELIFLLISEPLAQTDRITYDKDY